MRRDRVPSPPGCYVVMRLSPPRGHFGGRLGPHVAGRFDTAAAALTRAVAARQDARQASPYGRAWLRRATFWVEHLDACAHRGQYRVTGSPRCRRRSS